MKDNDAWYKTKQVAIVIDTIGFIALLLIGFNYDLFRWDLYWWYCLLTLFWVIGIGKFTDKKEVCKNE